MDNLGSAITSPFQGPQGAENALKLAGILAPRINLGGRPLQPGEGEGLRNLFSAFGQFAEQKRRNDAEGAVLSGLEAVMQGKTPISSLPVSDLPETMQRVLFEQVAQHAKRGAMSPAEQTALMNAASTIAHRGGDPLAAMRAMGLSVRGQAEASPDTPSPVSSPRGAVSMSQDTELVPSMLQRSSTPEVSGSLFGRQDAALSAQAAHERLAELVQTSQGTLRRPDVITALSGMPADDAKFQVAQLELAGLLPPDLLARTQEAQEQFPGFFPPEVETAMKPSGPEVQFKPRVPHNLPPGHAGVVTGPQGEELSRIPGPPAPAPEMERMIQLLPPALQRQAREVYTGIRPKAGEERRADETERSHKANEGLKEQSLGKGKSASQGQQLITAKLNEIRKLQEKPGVAGWQVPVLGARTNIGATPKETIEDQVEAMKQNARDAIERRAIDIAWDRYLQEQMEGGTPNDQQSAIGSQPPRVVPPRQGPRQSGRARGKAADDFFKKYPVGE